jgi:hypothetical protein
MGPDGVEELVNARMESQLTRRLCDKWDGKEVKQKSAESRFSWKVNVFWLPCR